MSIAISELSPALQEAIKSAGDGYSIEMSIQNIELDHIIPGNNDRVKFSHVEDLSISIMGAGRVMMAITVRQIGADLYRIAAGESRYRAVSLLHKRFPDDQRWLTIPAIVREMDDEEEAAVMLLENTARQNLNPIEEAQAYESRIRRFGWDVEQCAKIAGRKVQFVKNRIELLKLRDDIQDLIRSGNLEPQYGQIMAAAGLDNNFQALALTAFQNNPSPTPAWFRAKVGELLEQQAQAPLFDFFALPPCVASIVEAPVEPPTPGTTVPPVKGRHPLNILNGQAKFWRKAANDWEKLGKYGKRDQCIAAAQAIETSIKLIEAAMDATVQSGPNPTPIRVKVVENRYQHLRVA